MSALQLKLLFAGMVLAIGAGVAYTAHERAVGRRDVLLHQADSLHAVAVKQHSQDSLALVKAVSEADGLRQAALRERAKDQVVQRRTDSTIKESVNVREQARLLLTDSSATLGAVRHEVETLVSASRADSAAFASERQQHERTVASLLATIHADSSALDKANHAIQSAVARAVASESEVKLLKASLPSGVKQWGTAAVYIGVGVLAARLVR